LPFSQLGLHPHLVRAVTELGFTQPTPIQAQAIPPALAGRDVLACAATGSGKTAAFLLPLLHRLSGKPRGITRVLVLTPTRELAAQIEQHLRAMARYTPYSGAAIFGGMGFPQQERAFRRGVDVIVATPGRLLDHFRQPYAALPGLEALVLDEADRMLDMGFLPEVRRILRHLPARRQTLFFSATMPAPIVTLSRDMLKDPVALSLAPAAAPAAGITHTAFAVAGERKPALLVELLRRGQIRSVIAFTRTKQRANRLADYLAREGVSAGRIHGNRSQSQRTQALAAFKAGRFPVLVATDLAARGIDVTALSHVVNFDVPHCAEDYVHRVGRTARAQAQGDAFLFVAPEEEGHLRAIERAIGAPLARVRLDGFAAAAGAAPAAHRPAPAARRRRSPGGPARSAARPRP
jgi:ATP-dependent RNA helicase RhlE